MDKPHEAHQQIPEEIKENFAKEVRKFNKYKLDNQLEFSNFLKKELSYKNPKKYLDDLYLIAAPLLRQDDLMYLLQLNNFVQAQYENFTEIIRKGVEDSTQHESSAFEILKWLSIHYPVILARRNQYLQRLVDYAQRLTPMFFNSKIYNQMPQIGKINSTYITRFIDTAKKREEAGDRFEKRHGTASQIKNIPDFHNEFHRESRKIGTLYNLLRPYYQLFYENILKEIHETLRKNNLNLPKEIKDLPASFLSHETFPPREKIFPFDEFINLIKEINVKNVKIISPIVPKITKKSSIDESYILEGDEDASHAIINNKKNNTVEEILKSNNQNKPANQPLKYTQNIIDWLSNPVQALKIQGYQTPGHKNFTAEHLQKIMIERHSFSRLIDDYINEAGIQGSTPNRRNSNQKDILISIPGKITYSDKTQETGYFSYIIDSKTKECYHRIFDPSNSKKMAKQLLDNGVLTPENPTVYDVMFPSLQRP